jgi:hypothetical protein
MSALWLLFRALPILVQLGALAAGLAAIGGTYAVWRHSLIVEGEAKNQSRIDQQNQGAKDAADKAAVGPDECDAAGRVWDVAAGECSGP